jgi:predicted ribosome quality control (RQC) complex YloA/Tae2 family protein
MKALAAFEIKFVVSELQKLIGARLDRIFNPSPKEALLEFYSTTAKKAIVRATPNALYIASSKPSEALEPSSFCVVLRKYLKNSRLKAVFQHFSERVIEFDVSSSTTNYRLIFELFSRGNIILCDEKGMIIAAAERQSWSTRKIAAKEQYKLPPSRFNLFELKAEELFEMFKQSSRDSAVKVLASDLGLGGTYAEELCILSSVDKLTEPKKISGKDVEKILSAFKEMLVKKPQPVVVYEAGKIRDVVPFPLRYYERLEQKPFASYNEALDGVLTNAAVEEIRQNKDKPRLQKIASLKLRISNQEEMLKSMAASVDENRRKGELIYENYQEIKDILAEAKAKDFAALKKRKNVVSVDEKTLAITVDLQ